MARPVVGNPFENQVPSISPTARVVETYVQPVKNKDFEALTQMLNDLDPKVKRNAENNKKRADDLAYKEGTRLYQENRIAMGEAVKEGLIPEGASPYLRKGYRESQMNTLAMRYTGELEAALASENLHHNDDPNVVNKFISDFQSDFVEANGMSKFSDAEMATNFGTSASKAEELFRQSWQNKHIEWQKEENYKQLGNEVYEAVSTMLTDDMDEVEYLTNQGLFGVWLEQTAAKYSTNGANNAKVLDTIIDAIGVHVEETGDLEVLEVFKQTKFGTDVVANSLYYKKKESTIVSRSIQLENARIAREEKILNQKHEEQRAKSARYMIEYLQDPSPENEMILKTAIVALKVSPEEKNTSLAVAYNNQLLAMQKSEQLGGQNKTAESELNLDAALSKATTYEQASSIILRYAGDGKVSADGVNAKLNVWKQQYDPSNDTSLGLDFVSQSTEKRMMDDIEMLIKGNMEEYDDARIHTSILVAAEYRAQMRLGVKLFKEANDGRFPTAAEMDLLSTNQFNMIVAKYQYLLTEREQLPPNLNN